MDRLTMGRIVQVPFMMAVAIGTAACSPQKYENSCHTPLPGWRTERDFLDHEGMVFELKINSTGKLIAVGPPATEISRLSDTLDELASISPEPQVILSPDPQAPCDQVRRTRMIMEKSRLCQQLNHFYCFEGRRNRMAQSMYGPRAPQ